MSGRIALYQWTLHGSGHHCGKCQGLAGKVQPMEAWSLRPGFHPHCGCTLDFFGWYGVENNEPTLWISILAFPIMKIADQYNPIKSTNPLAFPICAFISNNASWMTNEPFSIKPAPDAFPPDLQVPVIVNAPKVPETPKVDTSRLKQAPRLDPTNKRKYEAT
jgi:hypothetical protein